MAEAARQASGVAGPTWIMALRQTAARGRRGRQWVQPEGNFAATLIWPSSASVSERALRSFVAALALRDAFVAATDMPDTFQLKWPNDVLLNGGKVAGILLESNDAHLAIGFGVNLLAAPDPGMIETGAVPPASLAEKTGYRLSPEQFLDHLAPAYAAREAEFTTYGFQPILNDWLAHAARLGQEIKVRTNADKTMSGIFETVDKDGMLVLNTPIERLRIAAADVFF